MQKLPNSILVRIFKLLLISCSQNEENNSDSCNDDDTNSNIENYIFLRLVGKQFKHTFDQFVTSIHPISLAPDLLNKISSVFPNVTTIVQDWYSKKTERLPSADELILYFPQLKHLKLCKPLENQTQYQQLCNFLPTQLTGLELEISSDHAVNEFVDKLITSLKNLAQLRKLLIGVSCHFYEIYPYCDEYMREYCINEEDIINGLSPLKNLQELQLPFGTYLNDFRHLTHLKHLRRLRIIGTCGQTYNLDDVLSQIPQLTHISFYHEDRFSVIEDLIKSPQIQSLELNLLSYGAERPMHHLKQHIDLKKKVVFTVKNPNICNPNYILSYYCRNSQFSTCNGQLTNLQSLTIQNNLFETSAGASKNSIIQVTQLPYLRSLKVEKAAQWDIFEAAIQIPNLSNLDIGLYSIPNKNLRTALPSLQALLLKTSLQSLSLVGSVLNDAFMDSICVPGTRIRYIGLFRYEVEDLIRVKRITRMFVRRFLKASVNNPRIRLSFQNYDNSNDIQEIVEQEKWYL